MVYEHYAHKVIIRATTKYALISILNQFTGNLHALP